MVFRALQSRLLTKYVLKRNNSNLLKQEYHPNLVGCEKKIVGEKLCEMPDPKTKIYLFLIVKIKSTNYYKKLALLKLPICGHFLRKPQFILTHVIRFLSFDFIIGYFAHNFLFTKYLKKIGSILFENYYIN